MSSIDTLASTAIILLSEVFKTGLISKSEASAPSYALYKQETNLVISLNALPSKPRLKATLRHWKGIKPVDGSISSVNIRWGVFSATSSISIPPSVEYISIFLPVERFKRTDI